MHHCCLLSFSSTQVVVCRGTFCFLSPFLYPGFSPSSHHCPKPEARISRESEIHVQEGPALPTPWYRTISWSLKHGVLVSSICLIYLGIWLRLLSCCFPFLDCSGPRHQSWHAQIIFKSAAFFFVLSCASRHETCKNAWQLRLIFLPSRTIVNIPCFGLVKHDSNHEIWERASSGDGVPPCHISVSCRDIIVSWTVPLNTRIKIGLFRFDTSVQDVEV